MKNKINHIVLISLLMLMGYFGYQSHQNSISYEIGVESLSKEMETTELLKCKAMLGMGDCKEKKEKLEKSNQQHKDAAKNNMIYFAVSIGVMLFLSYFASTSLFVIYGNISSAIALGFGIITPIFMILIQKDTWVGIIVFSFESKSIITSIDKLMEADMIIALLLFLFSIILPITKISLIFFISKFPGTKYGKKIIGFFKLLGKWSMLDVFVVAVFLVFFSTNGKGVSEAELEMGIYFFLMYIISSMLISGMVEKICNKKEC
jgi:paraquat-inducible protein A